MKNCKFCFRPVPTECYVMIRGRLSGKEFHVGDEAEFMCDECVSRFENSTGGLKVGDITLMEEEE